MANFRPFSTPSPLLIFPSASPTSKLQCAPTKKPPSPINWTEECHQGMLLEANNVHGYRHPYLSGERNRNAQASKNNVAREIIMDNTLRRHSTPDFMTLYHCENLVPGALGTSITDRIPFVTDQRLETAEAPSFTVSSLPASTNSPPNSSSNLSILSTSTSSMSYISSISSSEDGTSENQSDHLVILKPRTRRPRHVSMSHEQRMTTTSDINRTGTSWYSSSTQSITTTLREDRYRERFAKKRSKFSLLVAKMKRAAEWPFKLMDGPVI